MSARLEKLASEALGELSGASSMDAVLQLKTRYLGRKGEVASLLKELGSLSPEERKKAGEAINAVKARLEEAFDAKVAALEAGGRAERLQRERIDITLPGRTIRPGRMHPVTQVMEEIEEIFSGLGFDVAEGP